MPPHLLLCLLVAPAAVAAPLPLSEAVARAQAFHPEVQRARIDVDGALAQRVGASFRLPDSPQLSVAVGHRHDSSGSHPASSGPEWTVQLAQMVEVAGQRGQRLREVDWAVEVAQAHLREVQLEAAALGALDYLRVQSADALSEVADARSQLARRVLRIVRFKERAGATGGLERTLAEVEVAGAQAQQTQAQADVVAAREVLWLSLGLEPGREGSLSPLVAPVELGPPRTHAIDGAIDGLVQRAARARPRGRALVAMAAGLEATDARLRREAVPSPALLIEAQHQQPGQQYFGGGIALPLPLWRRQQGPRAAVRVALARNAIERRLFRLSVERELRTARAQLEAARHVFKTVHEQQLPASQAHADMTVEAWQAGKLDVTRVVQALRYLAEARAPHNEAVTGEWRAQIELGRVCGQPLGASPIESRENASAGKPAVEPAPAP